MAQLHATKSSAPEAEHHWLELLHEFETATLITRSRAGRLHGRPMSIAQVEKDGTMWFITDIESPKLQEIVDDSRAMVSMQNDKQYVAVNGNVEVVRDEAKTRELWKEQYRVWFKGEDDPELVLLRFSPFDAEYWDNAGTSGLRYAFKAAKAYLEGEQIGRSVVGDPELHGKVTV